MSKVAFSAKPRNHEQFDWILFVTYIGLVGIGLMMIFATTYHDAPGQDIWNISTPFGRQLLWAGTSLVVLIAVYFIEWQFWESLSVPLYIIGVVLLVALFFVGTEIKGAKSWLIIGSFSLQPSELAKFTTAVFLASFLSPMQVKLRDLKVQLTILSIIALPAFLIVLQPDPGSALTFGSFFILLYRRGLPTFYFVIFISVFLTVIFSLIYDYQLVISGLVLCWLVFLLDFKKNRLFSLMLLVALLLTTTLAYQNNYIGYAILMNITVAAYYLVKENRLRTFSTSILMVLMVLFLSGLSFSSSYAFDNVLKPHQQDRINVWLQPEKCDPRGSLYNLIQSKLAIGSGGVSGKGFLEGNLTKLNYVPEQTTDFIFSSIGEEQGFVGGAGVIILFLIMIFRISQIAERSRHAFIRNYGYSLAGFLFLHFFINIGMTMGVCPVIGIPLPFISKGGTVLLTFSIMIGVMLKMSRQR